MRHIKIPHLRPPQIHPLRQRLHIHRPQIHCAHRHHLPFAKGILAFHPNVRAARPAEVPVDALDAWRVIAEFRAGGGRVEGEVGGE